MKKSFVSGDKKAPNYIAREITDITFKPPEIPKDERKVHFHMFQ